MNFFPGQKLNIAIRDDNWDWGFRPTPKNCEATFVRYDEIVYSRDNQCGIEPGIYENTSWVVVEYLGKEILLSCRDILEKSKDEGDRISYLPETEFYEQDEVRFKNHIGRISQISYKDKAYVTRFNNQSESNISFDDKGLFLHKRGRIWLYYHGFPLEFSSLQEEIWFQEFLQKDEEVRNPVNGLYSWTTEEVQEALYEEQIDYAKFCHGSLSAFKLMDRELAKRSRESFIKFIIQ